MHRIHSTPVSKRRHLAKTWDVLGCIETAADADEVKSILLQIASHHGLHSLFAGWVPSTAQPLDRAEIAANIVHDHEPCEWTTRYVEQDYAARDPIVRHSRANVVPSHGGTPMQPVPRRTTWR